jgi:purple acid phosphatase-like protein
VRFVKNWQQFIVSRLHLSRFQYVVKKRYYQLRYTKPVRAFMRISPARRIALSGIMTVAIVIGLVFQLIPRVSAQTSSLNNNDLIEGTIPASDISIVNSGSALQLAKGNGGSWQYDDGTRMIPTTSYNDNMMTIGPNKNVYVITLADSQCHFMYYDVELRVWNNLTRPPYGCGSGVQLTYDGSGKMYFLPGNNSANAAVYDVGSDSWKILPDAPTPLGSGGSMVYATKGANKYLYAFRGQGSASFWRYDINAGTWSNMTAFPTASNVNNGMSATWDGNDTIYTLTADRGEFKKYSITTNSWTNISTLSMSLVRPSLDYVNGQVVAGLVSWGADKTYLRSYNPQTNAWTDLAQPPIGGHQYDWYVPFRYDGARYGYTLIGSDIQMMLYRYDFQNSTWDAKSLFNQAIDDTAHHEAMIYDGNQTIYFAAGKLWEATDRIYKYDIVSGTTTRIGTQTAVSSGSAGWAGVYYNGAVYFLGNENQKAFQKYDPTLNTWTQLADSPFNGGWGMTLTDGGDGYFYATFSNSNQFYRYSPSTNTWSALSTMPSVTYQGAGVTRIGRTLYVLMGNQTSLAYRYNMDTNVWTQIRDMPNGSIDHGAFLTGDSSRYLYADVGNRTDPQNRRFYRFDTQTDTWGKMTSLPDDTQPGASAIYDTVRGQIVVAQGFRNPHIWKWTPSSTAYAQAGTWYSKTMDLSQVESWTSLQYTTTGAGTVAPSVRTSSDGRIWSAWSQVTGGVVTAPKARYAQVKMQLSGDGTSTPTVSDISFQYNQETTAPTVPSVFTATKNDTDTVALTSGQTYEHQHPVFKWSGADDGTNGSGVDGYYVYFGTDSSADPVTQGSFQKTTKYTVTNAMTAGEIYYVKIKVKDRLGNTSPAATFFSYRYFYISPPGSQVVTSDSDFSSGINTGLSVQNGGIQLPQQTNGAWANGPIDAAPNSLNVSPSVVVGDYLYLMRANNSTLFYRYNLVNHIWETLASLPAVSANGGGSMTWDKSNYIYAIRGNNTTDSLYRYNINTAAWEIVVALPTNAQFGSDIAYIGNNKIAFFFVGVREFYIYDIDTKTFNIKTSYPDSISAAGTGIWYDGADSIYAYEGAFSPNSANRYALIRYSIANDSWRTMSQPPYIAAYNQNNLVGDGTGHLYVMGSSYVDNSDSHMRALKYTIATDSWETLPDYPGQSYYGSMSSDGDRYIYILPSNVGSDDRRIFRYDTLNNTFSPTLRAPDGLQRLPWDLPGNTYGWQQGNATTAAYDGSKYMYVIGADEAYFGKLMRYNPRTGETKYLSAPPVNGYGQSMTYKNGVLYLIDGRNTKEFYKYDIGERRWYRMADIPNIAYRPGTSTLTTLQDGRILAIDGNNRAIYAYTADSGQGSWVQLADAPGNILNGAAAYDATNGFLYVIAGNASTGFYRYNIGSNTWITLATFPVATNSGAAMVLHNGKIYASQGNTTKVMYVYDVSSNTWTNGVISPEELKPGAQFVQVDPDYFIVLSGDNSADFWRYNFPDTGRAYSGEGTHISQPMVMSGIYDYAGIKAEVDQPPNTQVEFFTRTSDDGTNWNNWSRTDEGKSYNGQISSRITSPAKRYIQVKVVLDSFDNLYTPTVGSYAIDYYYDVDPPNNPTSLNVYSNNTKTNNLTSNTWYNYADAFVDWPDPGEAGGATDGPLGSNIKGYYVYVGTDPTAQPVTAGQFVSSSQLQLHLTQSGTYYVRIQSQDITGNVSTSVFAPFIYKLDIDPPTSPSLVTVTPAGFTSIDKYSFQWPNGFDSHSGIKSYCYHTGATSGALATETCQTGTSLLDIPAQYRQGTNVFYVRTLDNAGNYSPAYTTTSYYYSTAAPSAVTNLRAVPPVSSQNLFAFIWDLPTLYSGDPNQINYCYAVNVLPSPDNTTCVSDRFIPAFKAATQQGTNLLYVVAKDEAGNVNWNNYASAIFIANTVSPGIPLNLTVTDTSDRARERWSLTATWDKPTFEGNGISTYIVERSEDAHTYTTIGKTSSRAYVDLDVEPDKTYYYRVRAADNVDNQGGSSGVVAQTPRGAFATPPAIVVSPSVKAGFDQATITWVTDRPSTSFVYYGTSPTNLTQSKGTLDEVNQHTINISGLSPTTTYFYKVQSFDLVHSYSTSDADSPLFTFRTSETARVYGVGSSDKTLNSIMLGWQTSVPITSHVEYGTTLEYGLSASASGSGYSTSETLRLNGLASGTTYHYRIVGTTESGSVLRSDDYTFTTLPRPVVSNVRIQPIEDASTTAVRVTWDTNVPTSSTLRYEALGVQKEVTLSDLVTSHEVTLSDLAGSTDYQFTIEGRDAFGNNAVADRQTWHSGIDTRPPKVDKVSVNVATVDSLKGSKAQMIVTWRTDEPSTTQLRYGRGSGKLNKTSPLDTDPSTTHTVIVSDLDVSEIYRIQAISRDISGNTTNGTTVSVVTPDKEVNVLDSLLNALQKVFRF